MTLRPGDPFDRYVIEELLGEGGMARVYRAHDPRLNRRVALKVLRLDSVHDPDSAADAGARVLREARASAALDHPNAVSVFDVGEAGGQVFLAMELVVGKSLRSYVGDESVPWELKLRWMVDAARALGAAHERGLVHRDIKPENVMVRADGVVKVLDFGIAQRTHLGIDESATEQSVRGTLAGTPSYLSPEQLRGEPVDGRADQFAWGVTAYELLTGARPWPRQAEGFQLVLAILQHTPEAPSKKVPAVPSIVDATILKALAKPASQRFEVMEFVVSALEGVSSPGRRSLVEVHVGATAKTDPAPPMPPASPPAPSTDGVAALESRRAPRRLRRPATLAVLVIAAAGVLAVGSARLTRGERGERAEQDKRVSSAGTPAAARPMGPVGLLDLPPPKTASREAADAYRAYRQAFRDADWSSAVRQLETAVEHDPAMAAAQLRLAFMQSLESTEEGHVRATFMAATRNRDALDARDAALLDALEPYLQRDPSDPRECEKRLEALHARWPLDAEIAYDLGSVRYDRGDLAAAAAAFDAAIAVDPGFAQAWSSKGGVLAYLGRFDDARAALDEAQKRSRTATEPLWYQAEIAEQQGRCADEESAVREWLSRDPDDPFAYEYLASALAAEGKPVESVRTALEQKWVRLAPDQRARREPYEEAQLAAMTGDFATAEKRLVDLERGLASEPGAQAHAEPQLQLMRLAEESGDAARARAIASSYLDRKDAWTPPHRVDDVAIFFDPIPQMLGTLAGAAAVPAAQVDERRAAWLAPWRAKTSAAYVGYLWIAAWALPARTREQGEAALRALQDFGAVPPFLPTEPEGSMVGHAYFLAGRMDEAVPALKQGLASCTVLFESFLQTRGALELGLALEARGDRDGACGAYDVVLSRWGRARPRSVTAERARSRASALGCPDPEAR